MNTFIKIASVIFITFTICFSTIGDTSFATNVNSVFGSNIVCAETIDEEPELFYGTSDYSASRRTEMANAWASLNS